MVTHWNLSKVWLNEEMLIKHLSKCFQVCSGCYCSFLYVGCFCVIALYKCTSTTHFLSLLLTKHVGGHVETAFMQAYSRFKTIINPSNQHPVASEYLWQPSFLYWRDLGLILIESVVLHNILILPSYSIQLNSLYKMNGCHLDLMHNSLKNVTILILRAL